LSSLVDFEDLNELDGGDLKAVFGQVDPEQVLTALLGVSPGQRRRLLTKLSPASASALEAQLVAHDPITPDTAAHAQRAVVEALCRLSRGGQVAFDDPADIFTETAA
jgi:flagellar motor switch protein FliG